MTRFESLYGVALPPRKRMELLLLFLAAESLLAFSYLGVIILPHISTTTLHVPVILAAMMLGTGEACAVGLVFMLTVAWKATISAVQYSDLIFSPVLSGDPAASLLMGASRVVFALVAGLMYAWYFRRGRRHEYLGVAILAVAASVVHNALVYSAMMWFFPGTELHWGVLAPRFLDGTRCVMYAATAVVVALCHYGLKRDPARRFFARLARADALHQRFQCVYVGLTSVAVVVCLLSYLQFHSRVDMLFSGSGVAVPLVSNVHQLGLQFLAGLTAALVIFMIAAVWCGGYFSTMLYEAQETTSERERRELLSRMNRRLMEKNERLEAQKLELQEAVERAEKASRAKSIFLNNMSHDIRTPMNAVIGFTSLAQESINDPAVAAGYLGKVKDAGGHLLQLLDDVLDITRIESGRIHLNEENVDLKALFSALPSLVEPLVRKKRLKLEVSEPEGGLCVLTDHVCLNQILLNLLSNAVKYTPDEGSVRLIMQERPALVDGEAAVTFRVEDTGIGMSEEFLRNGAFQPFSREQSASATGIPGTGLGLSIVKNLVERLGGTLSVESHSGEGTTMTLNFSFRRVDKVQEPVGAKAQDASAMLKGREILLVEDNELNREIAGTILDHLGVKVTCAEDGVAALEKIEARSEPFDCILMDIQMPRMDGLEATRRLRRLSDARRAATPVIVMSADVFEERRKEAAGVGICAYVTKPFTVEKLTAVLEECLKRRSSTPPKDGAAAARSAMLARMLSRRDSHGE